MFLLFVFDFVGMFANELDTRWSPSEFFSFDVFNGILDALRAVNEYI